MLAYIIVIGAIIWTLYLTIKYWKGVSWAFGLMILGGCVMFTPLIIWFISKLTRMDDLIY